jgi:recombination associated protein RdgC
MPWFKNLQVYRLPAPWPMTAEQIHDQLVPYAFTPGGTLEGQTKGWVSPRENDSLVHGIKGQLLLSMRTEKKLLPTSVINQFTKAKAADIEAQQGFKPGRKQMREIKEAVTDELRPKAFSMFRDTQVWIDTQNGWLVINAASSGPCDEVIELLHKSIDPLPLALLHTNQGAAAAMTNWLLADEAPAGFSIDQDTELRSTGDSKASVRYQKQSVEVEEVRRHIQAGKQTTRLAMTWADRVSFMLTESLAIKRVAALDVLKEQADVGGAGDDERFDADFVLMTGELAKLIADVVDALGGEQQK